jgi:hypothetical protein
MVTLLLAAAEPVTPVAFHAATLPRGDSSRSHPFLYFLYVLAVRPAHSTTTITRQDLREVTRINFLNQTVYSHLPEVGCVFYRRPTTYQNASHQFTNLSELQPL